MSGIVQWSDGIGRMAGLEQCDTQEIVRCGVLGREIYGPPQERNGARVVGLAVEYRAFLQ